MAEAANVRQNLQNVPSIFEIFAAETLDNLIYPALTKIFDFVGLRVDFKLGQSQRIREEISPFVTWLLQYLYLCKRGSSFGESFYGLQRRDTSGNRLSRQKGVISATLLVLLPYIERKLKAKSQREDISKWEEYLLKFLNVYKVSKAIHTFLYLIKYTSNHSLIFKILKLTLRYPNEPPKDDKTTYIFLKVLEVLAFFLQFIQWWYSNDQRRKFGSTLQNPEPMLQTMKGLKETNTSPGNCPICLMKIENPTACSVSGFVYCWKCIATRLRQHSPTCSETGYSITIDDLIRIYE